MRYTKLRIIYVCLVLITVVIFAKFINNMESFWRAQHSVSSDWKTLLRKDRHTWSKANEISATDSQNSSIIPSCVPHHTYLTVLMHENKGQWWKKSMTLQLLSAYNYDTHVVVTLQSQGWFGKLVYCRYLSSDFIEIDQATAGMTYPEYSVNCCPGNKTFSYISVTKNRDDPIIQYVPVLKRNAGTSQYEFSMCLSPIYGKYSTFLMFTELIEHYKLQGVEHFYVYIHDMDEYSERVLHDYVRSGEVELIYFDWREDRYDWTWVLVERIDCVFRTRYHSKYVITADLDERILPLSPKTTLREFTRKEFDAKPMLGLLSFRPRWILRDRIPPERYEGIKTIKSDLATLVFRNTSHWPPPGHTAKCIIDPLKLVNMGIHKPDAFLPGNNMKYVPPEDAIIRHYRDVIISSWKIDYYPETLTFGNYSLTNYPDELHSILIRNVVQRLDRVYPEKIIY